jgi:hypothetical protein
MAYHDWGDADNLKVTPVTECHLQLATKYGKWDSHAEYNIAQVVLKAIYELLIPDPKLQKSTFTIKGLDPSV